MFTVEPERQRLDRWLYFARIVKSRSLAAKLAVGGKVRINRNKADQAAQPVKPGDVLTVTLERGILVYRVIRTGTRRGPAREARELYEDLSHGHPEATPENGERVARREPGSGRPTKKDRRAMARYAPK